MVNALNHERNREPVRELHERGDVGSAPSKDAHFSLCSARRRETLDGTPRNPAGARLNDVYLKAAVLAAIVFMGHSDSPTPEIATPSEHVMITDSRELPSRSTGSAIARCASCEKER